MTVVTIGSFTTNRLIAQPFGYEGEARFGLTARTFRVSGLLSPTEWQTLISEYNSWRSTRIQDPDTLVSKVVGTTIPFSTGVSINNLSVTNLACWFAQAPQGDQAGKYVSATVVLVDAAQALAVILREQETQNEETVDCATITARLTRQRNETDCELAALAAGLADDFAVQRVTREVLEKTADLGARASEAGTLAGLDAQLNVQARTAELGVAGTYAQTLQGLAKQLEVINSTAELGVAGTYAQTLQDLQKQLEVINKTAEVGVNGTYAQTLQDLQKQLEVINSTAEVDVASTYAQTLQDLQKQLEVINKTAEVGVNGTYATDLGALAAQLELQQRNADLTNTGVYGADLADIQAQIDLIRKANQLTTVQTYGSDEAEIDLQLEKAQADSRLAAYQAGDLAGLRGTLLDIEIEEADADLTAISTRVEALKASRTTKALWDRYLSEDLVPHGTESYGGATITLTAPTETRSNGPQVQFTATGNTLISGAPKSMLTKRIIGYTNSTGASGLLSWYDSTVAAPASAGQWFPTEAPSFTTEYVLVAGVKSTRYNVQMTVVQLT